MSGGARAFDVAAATGPAYEDGITMPTMKPRSFHPAIDKYLSDVRKHLKGLVPQDRANMSLEETAYWIQCESRALNADGMEEDAAMSLAVEKHEDARTVAYGLIEDYFESQDSGPLVKRLGRANAIVFSIFGIATGLHLLLLEFAVNHPVSGAIHSSLSLGTIHKFYPEGLPFPEMSWQFIVTIGIPLIGPWFLGWWAGRLVPVRSASAVAMGLTPLILFTLIVAVSLLPDKSAMLYAAIQLFYWLPVACLMAHLSSSRQTKLRQMTP